MIYCDSAQARAQYNKYCIRTFVTFVTYNTGEKKPFPIYYTTMLQQQHTKKASRPTIKLQTNANAWGSGKEGVGKGVTSQKLYLMTDT